MTTSQSSPRTIAEFQKSILKELANIPYQSQRETFSDFVKCAAYAISNRVDLVQTPAREQSYMTIAKRLQQDMYHLSTAITHLVMLLGCHGYKDHLGELFHMLLAERKEIGQFFTPYNISSLLCRLIMTDDEIRTTIDKKGYVLFNEPTCGSGGMIIAFAERLVSLGFNPSECLCVMCQDIDSLAVAMTYVQLSLYDIAAVVIQGDTLKNEKHVYLLGG